MGFYQKYKTLIAEIEQNYPVHEWRMGDVDVWPLMRMEIYLEMHRSFMGGLPDGKLLAFVKRVARRQTSALYLKDLSSGREWPLYEDLDRDLPAQQLPQ